VSGDAMVDEVRTYSLLVW